MPPAGSNGHGSNGNGDGARVRVLVADAQPLYRDAICRAVRRRPELELVGDSPDGREALQQIVRLTPDVAVLDLGLGQVDGARVLNAVSRDGLESRVMLLSVEVDAAVAYDVIEAGAAGYLSKDVEADELCDAIAAVGRGQTVLAPEVQAGIASEIRLRRSDERPILSERERQILGLVADGLTAPQMARRLHLSVGTVKTHLLHVYEKLGVCERAAAVAEAMRRGLLE
jgi:two-component system nitrate/nitrite response regulator NarL